MFKDASEGAWEGIDWSGCSLVYCKCGRWGFRWWLQVRVCLSWGHWVRSPGVPTGYGLGRRIDWDRIMSDVGHLRVLECVEVPAVPIHLVIEVYDGNIEVLNVGAHNLTWSSVWIAKAFSKPVGLRSPS